MDEQRPQARIRAKFIPFRTEMPIQGVLQEGDSFSLFTKATVILKGRGRIDGSKTDNLPAEFADHGWLSIDLTEIEYCGQNLYPLLSSLPEAKPLLRSFENFAKKSVIAIYNHQLEA